MTPGLEPADIPLGNGSLLVELVSANPPWLNVGTVGPDGRVTFDLPIPDVPAWDGIPLYLQAILRDRDTEGRVGMSDGTIGVLHLP